MLAILLTTFLLTAQTSSQDIGKPCQDRYTQQWGICKTVDDCPDVREKATRGIAPTVCGFLHNTISIVCCETDLNILNINKPIPVFKPNPEPPVFIPQTIPEPQNKPKSISEIKCEEYAKYTRDSVVILPLVTIPDPTMLNIKKCEYDGIPLIVGGVPAVPGEFPFMAALNYSDNTIKCGGTLISDRYVLTAGHCIRTKAGPPVSVRIGDLNLAKDDDITTAVTVGIEENIMHPGYRPPKKYNDIALIRLNQQVKFNNFLRPACLYNKPQIVLNRALAAGYGSTSFSSEISNKLLKVALDLFDNSLCAETFSADKKNLPRGVESSMLCAGELKGNKDTCQGDSGGPLLITQNDNNCLHYAVGVTSFGRSCGAMNTPAIYTRVSEFVPWIEDIVWK